MPIPIRHNTERTRAIRLAIDALAEHPPATPMERLQAALLMAEATQVLNDAAEHEERTRRRTTLPEGYRVHRRRVRSVEDEPWVTHHGRKALAVSRSREQANQVAWEHHDAPELFVLDYGADDKQIAQAYLFEGGGVRFYIAAGDMATACAFAARECCEEVDEYVVRHIADDEAATIAVTVEEEPDATLLAILEAHRRDFPGQAGILSHSEL